MATGFDPYHMWLGISAKDQPPNHYRLLALELYESNPDVIDGAADQRMAHVRTFQTGENAAVSQRILNELSTAKLCLLDAKRKGKYDQNLHRELAATQTTRDVSPLSAIVVDPPAVQFDIRRSAVPSTTTKPRPRWQVPAVIGAATVVAGLVLCLTFDSGSSKPTATTMRRSAIPRHSGSTKPTSAEAPSRPESKRAGTNRTLPVTRNDPATTEAEIKVREPRPTPPALADDPRKSPPEKAQEVTREEPARPGDETEPADEVPPPSTNAAATTADSTEKVDGDSTSSTDSERPTESERPPSIESSQRPTLPSGDALANARQLVVETFDSDLSADDKAAAVQSLLKAAAEARDDLLGQAALLLVAVDVATEAYELRLAFEAHDELGRRFDYDTLGAKITSIEVAAKAARTIDARTGVVNWAMEIIDEAVAAKRFDVAERAGKSAQATVAKIKGAELRKEVAAKRKELEKRHKLHDAKEKALSDARNLLERSPDNGAANELVGRHLCFDRNDWPTGLKHLAKATDEKLQAAALKEIDGAGQPERQVSLGDRWWELAEAAGNERDRFGFRTRAVFWYGKAKADLSGLSKAKVEKRLKAAADAVTAAATQEVNHGAKYLDVVLASGVTMRLVKIPASADVKIRSFYMGQTEVTQHQWQAVIGKNPSSNRQNELQPVDRIDFADCQEFCTTLNRSAVGRDFVFRLPTPAEWFYAYECANPAKTHSIFGELADRFAWTKENTRGSDDDYRPVATKSPNDWDLYDMLGNAAEFASDGSVYGINTWYGRDQDTLITMMVKRTPWIPPKDAKPRGATLRVAADVQ